MNKYGEPWTPAMAGEADDVIVAKATKSFPVCRVIIPNEIKDELGMECWAFRNRIIACVNALADIENPEAVKKLIEATRALEEVSSRPNSEVEYYMAKTRLYIALAALDRKEPPCPPKP